MKKRVLFLLLLMGYTLIFISGAAYHIALQDFMVSYEIGHPLFLISKIYSFSYVIFAVMFIVYFAVRKRLIGLILSMLLLLQEGIYLINSFTYIDYLRNFINMTGVMLIFSLISMARLYCFYLDNQEYKLNLVWLIVPLTGIAGTVLSTFTSFNMPQFIWIAMPLIPVSLLVYNIIVQKDEVNKSRPVTVTNQQKDILYCRKCGHSTDHDSDSNICTHCGFNYLNGYAYCQHCGSETQEGQELCTSCGSKLANGYKSHGKAVTNRSDLDHKPNFGFSVLGFFIPLVGLILYLVLNATEPGKASSAGKGAIAGLIVGFLGTIVYYSLFIAFLTPVF